MYVEARPNPGLMLAAGPFFLNQSGISAELAAQGFLNENSRPFAAASVKSMPDP
jgi:hypothetical protein